MPSLIHKAAAQALRQELDFVTNTRSWKVTAPLRKWKGAVRSSCPDVDECLMTYETQDWKRAHFKSGSGNSMAELLITLTSDL